MANERDKEVLSAEEFVRRVKAERQAKQGVDYRREALSLLAHVCGKCGRTFDGKDLSLLTVHHRDGNHFNNPKDGSNWELLCDYCHEDEHSREILAGQLAPSAAAAPATSGERMFSLADKLKLALNKGK